MKDDALIYIWINVSAIIELDILMLDLNTELVSKSPILDYILIEKPFDSQLYWQSYKLFHVTPGTIFSDYEF